MTKKYRNIETWQKAMRKDKNKTLWADWFCIGGHWYVCEEYDDSGKYMRYTSVTAGKHIDIETGNRYSWQWLQDMHAISYEIENLRFSLEYYFETKDELREWVKKEVNNSETSSHKMIGLILEEMQKGIHHARNIISVLVTNK